MHDKEVEEIRTRRKLLVEQEFHNSSKVLGDKLREFEKKLQSKVVDIHKKSIASKT